jgi:hypothetical protein
MLDPGARRGLVVSATCRLIIRRERHPANMVLAAEWVSEPVWMGTENLDFTGFRTPDRPAHSKSLFYVHMLQA